MKIFKHRNILGLIFGLMALIPLVSIGVKCAYVSMNKNAKDSYSGNTELTYYDKKEYPTNEINNNGDLIVGNYYRFYYGDVNGDADRWSDYAYNDMNIISIYGYYIDTNLGITLDEIIIPLVLDNNTYTVNIYFDLINSNITLYYFDLDSYYAIYIEDGISDDSYFIVEYSNDFTNSFNSTSEYKFFAPIQEGDIAYPEYELKTIEQSNLDNVFEYSINEITKDSNLGKVGFFTWFASMFLDLNNATNMLYIGFVNWYFNYLLLVSLGYVLFAVLMWFINYIRRLLEKGQDFGQGGY